MAEQIVLPFRTRKSNQTVDGPQNNEELVGLGYFDGDSNVNVIGCSHSSPALVIVQRERDGKTWTVPSGLIRHIVSQKQRRLRIA